MNLPTIIGALVVFGVVALVVARGLYRRKHQSGGGCGGCSGCPSKGICHPE